MAFMPDCPWGGRQVELGVLHSCRRIADIAELTHTYYVHMEFESMLVKCFFFVAFSTMHFLAFYLCTFAKVFIWFS